jgi:hypothetical protein
MSQSAWSIRQGLSYGSLGMALAFVALPLYVLLPNHYAREYGVGLSTLGLILLGARLLDALIDPALGRGIDDGQLGGCGASAGFCCFVFPTSAWAGLAGVGNVGTDDHVCGLQFYQREPSKLGREARGR